jgi:hypothetical protein
MVVSPPINKSYIGDRQESHIGDPDKERCRLRTTQHQRKYQQWLCDAPHDFLRCIWYSRLPPNVRAILAGHHEGDLNAAAHCADRIIEAAPQPMLESIAPLPEINALLQHIEDLFR